MSRGAQLRVSRTKSIPKPNAYIHALYGEYGSVCLDEEAAPLEKGKWRSSVFLADADRPLDLEIGTGNGTHFSHRATQHPERLLLGLELKYKPLIQTIRRAINAGCTNVRAARYNAVLMHELFEQEEINDVFIHFPDPWSKSRQHKHRLLQIEFLNRLWEVQRPHSYVELKTDSREYFDWALDKIAQSRYTLAAHSFDLHSSQYAANNYRTQFENIFLREGLPIHYALLKKE